MSTQTEDKSPSPNVLSPLVSNSKQMEGNKVTDIQGNEVPDIQVNKVTDIQANEVTNIEGNKVTNIQGNKVTDIQGNKVTDIQVIKMITHIESNLKEDEVPSLLTNDVESQLQQQVNHSVLSNGKLKCNQCKTKAKNLAYDALNHFNLIHKNTNNGSTVNLGPRISDKLLSSPIDFENKKPSDSVDNLDVELESSSNNLAIVDTNTKDFHRLARQNLLIQTIMMRWRRGKVE